MSKSAWLALLVAVNLALLAGVFLVAGTPARAFAAPAAEVATGCQFAVVTAEVQSDLDGAFVLDADAGKLYMFTYDRKETELAPAAVRDLREDFGRDMTAAAGKDAKP